MSLLLLHVFFICVNIGFFVISDFSGLQLGGQTLPPGINSTGGLEGDLAELSNPTADDGSPLSGIVQFAESASSATLIMFKAVTGGFIFDSIDNTVLDLPDAFVTGMQSLIGILLAVQVFYWWTGRSSPKLT